MKQLIRTLVVAIFATLTVPSALAAVAGPVHELRIYTTHPGKMPDLLKRFREHTCALFEKQGMENVGYWLPADEKDPNKLYYLLKHASRDAAKASWQAFMADAEWKTVRAASEAAGPIVSGVESIFLEATDYSPAVPANLGKGHVYELRTYHCNDGKLDALDARFRNHTLALFARHGMINLPYWHPTDADKGAGKTLVYLLAHADREAAKKSWTDFRADPQWMKVREESEKDGKFLTANPTSVYLVPVDFSKLQ